jgi:hypothetical protein
MLHSYAMVKYEMVVEQSADLPLPESLRVALRPLRLTDPSGMQVYRVELATSSLGDDTYVFSTRILNADVRNGQGAGGYLYRLRSGHSPNHLASYESIAKVRVVLAA